MLSLFSLQMTNTGRWWKPNPLKTVVIAGCGCGMGRQRNKRGVEVVIGDKTLKILIINMFFALNILRMPIFQWFPSHIHCNMDLGLSVVKEMGFELPSTQKKLVKTE